MLGSLFLGTNVGRTPFRGAPHYISFRSAYGFTTDTNTTVPLNGVVTFSGRVICDKRRDSLSAMPLMSATISLGLSFTALRTGKSCTNYCCT